MKRWRAVTARPGELKIAYGRCEGDNDIIYAGGDGTRREDRRLLHHYIGSERPPNPLSGTMAFDPSLLDELESRGYDLTTLRFSIRKKDTAA